MINEIQNYINKFPIDKFPEKYFLFDSITKIQKQMMINIYNYLNYPEVHQALHDRNMLIRQGFWCRFYANSLKTELEYGIIHANGMHEKAQSSRRYFVDNGEVKYIVIGHL